MVEHALGKGEAAGSIPAPGSSFQRFIPSDFRRNGTLSQCRLQINVLYLPDFFVGLDLAAS